MKKLSTFAFILFSLTANAQTTYLVPQLGLSKDVNPYSFAIKLGSSWSELGTITPSGQWAIPATNLTYSQGIANTITRTVSSKLRESKSIYDFGAKCDGVTDDAAAINNALSSGYNIYFPQNNNTVTTCLFSSTLVIYTGTSIDGADKNKVVLKASPSLSGNAVETYQFTTLTGTDVNPGPYDFNISNITIDANKANRPAISVGQVNQNNGLAIYGSGFIISHVKILNAPGNGMWTEWWSSLGGPGIGLEADINNMTIYDSGGSSWVNKGPHDLASLNVIMFGASRIADKAFSGFYTGGFESGRHINLHYYQISPTGNQAAYAADIGSYEQITLSHFEGAYQAARFRGVQNQVENSIFYNADLTSGQSVVEVCSGNNIISDSQIFGKASQDAAGTPVVYGIQIGCLLSGVPTFASSNSLVNNFFGALATGGPYNFLYDSGYNVISGTGNGFPGGATSIVGSPNPLTSIQYSQTGTNVQYTYFPTNVKFNGVSPRLDSVNAFQINSNSGQTILSTDTLNKRIGINTTGPISSFQVNGTSFFGGASVGQTAVSLYNIDSTNAGIEAVDPTNITTKRNLLISPYGGKTAIGTSSAPTSTMTLAGSLSVPHKIKVLTNYVVQESDLVLIFSCATNCSVTLPTASSYPGRILKMTNQNTTTVTATTSNIVAVDGTSAGSSIFPATVGKWLEMISNGTDWYIIAGN
jgi:hypothetical protein